MNGRIDGAVRPDKDVPADGDLIFVQNAEMEVGVGAIPHVNVAAEVKLNRPL